MPFRPALFLTRLADAVLDLFSPPVCFLCGNPTHRRRRALCWECLAKPLIPADEKMCALCGARIAGAGLACAQCQRKQPAFERARAAVVFAGNARKLVHCFKYQKSTWLCNDFADWLHGCLAAHFAGEVFDCLVPVPVTRQKYRQRGYNQSELLALALGRRVSLPVLPRALARKGGLLSQTTLARNARARNVARAFRVAQPRRVKNMRVLLVDDVFTTGATANACARELLRNGAASVHVITVARGMLE